MQKSSFESVVISNESSIDKDPNNKSFHGGVGANNSMMGTVSVPAVNQNNS
jgi:hypothetical protein